MKNVFTALLFFISVSLFSQDEKRLALVIGNANYEKGELKNPVNDARLIASTLDSLEFDVILKENLESQTSFKRAILEFGKKRSNYDVAFVYYAGHGVQISGENYLLPTKVEFSTEDEVEMFGVSVQDIMRYLRDQTDEVNILILDACRDNPFESNWNTTRSLKGGGLAKIPPPTGSLIAFSTDSGQTAPDGEGDNSIYTISLAKNMLLEDTSIDQVFRNVRTEVLNQTDGMQRPVEATQLTGQTFYLKKRVFFNEIKSAEKLIHEHKYNEAITLLESINKSDPSNIDIVMLLSKAYFNFGGEYAISRSDNNWSIVKDYFKKSDDLLTNYIQFLKINSTKKSKYNLARIYARKSYMIAMDYFWKVDFFETMNNKQVVAEKILNNFNNAISINPEDNAYQLYQIGSLYTEVLKLELRGRNYIEKAISTYLNKSKLNADDYFYLAYSYSLTNNYEKAEKYFDKILTLSDDNIFYYEWISNYYISKKEYLKALNLLEKITSICKSCGNSIYFMKIAELYFELENYEKSISSYTTFYNTNSSTFLNNLRDSRGRAYYKNAIANNEKKEVSNSNLIKSLNDFNDSILKITTILEISDLSSLDFSSYIEKNDYESNLVKRLKWNLYYRAKVYEELAKKREINDFSKYAKLSICDLDLLLKSDDFGVSLFELIEKKSYLHYNLGEYRKSISFIEKIILENKNLMKNELSEIYTILGMIQWTINDNLNSLNSKKKALELNPTADNHSNYAVALYENDFNDLALKHFNISVDMTKNNDPIYLNNRGVFFQLTQKFELALKDFNRIKQIIDYFDLDLYVELLKTHSYLNDKTNEIKYAKEINNFMNNSLSNYWLYEVYNKNEKLLDAIIHLSIAINRFNDNIDVDYFNKEIVSYFDYSNTQYENSIILDIDDLVEKKNKLKIMFYNFN